MHMHQPGGWEGVGGGWEGQRVGWRGRRYGGRRKGDMEGEEREIWVREGDVYAEYTVVNKIRLQI